MSRQTVRKIIGLALLVALAAPPVSVFGQFPGGPGGRGFGGGRRMRGQNWGNLVPQVIPVPTPATPEEPKKEEKTEKKEPAVPAGPPPVVRSPAIENPAVLADQRMRLDEKKNEVSFNFQE